MDLKNFSVQGGDKEVMNTKFGAILADPPWKFPYSGGKANPSNKRHFHYKQMELDEICAMPIGELALMKSHLYLWVPNAIPHYGMAVMEAWGFEYRTMITWIKTTQSGNVHCGGCGCYFRNATEQLFFGTRHKLVTLDGGRTQPNVIVAPKREHSRKPDKQYKLIEECSPGPYLEVFARQQWEGWEQWGNEVTKYVVGV